MRLSGPLFGEPTSTLDWCEDNYEVTWYIAEFWNTLTNLSMIVPSLYGIYQAQKQGLEARYSRVL
jgi:dihydroceramidase